MVPPSEGSDLIKIMATGGLMTPAVDPEDAHYSPEELAAGIAEGHRFHKSCVSHVQGAEGSNERDASDKYKAIVIRDWPVLGMYQPDAIAAYRFFGKTYLVTADEGDEIDGDERIRLEDQYSDGKEFELDTDSFSGSLISGAKG